MNKPQIVPRTSLLKKKSIDSTSVENDKSDESIPATTTLKMKPALPVKPKSLIGKQRLNNESTNSIQPMKTFSNDNVTVNNVSINHQIPASEAIQSISQPQTATVKTNKSVVKQPQQQQQRNRKIKFRLTTTDLNRLRLRRDFDDKSIDSTDSIKNSLIYDIREDDEQIKKLNEIFELLIAGGYFRARIKGLHNFDKIIGGMCWAIQMCNIDLDIDIFYQENLTIGQKIALTEKIVCVLQKMKCPFKLEPHQIQGMDCIHIYPAIQWLVKKSLETRQQTADYVRQYCSWQFDRMFSLHNDQSSTLAVIINNNNELIDPIKENLQRRFLHPNRSKLKNETIRIKTTLLEYGIVDVGLDDHIITSQANNDKNDEIPDQKNDKEKSESIESKLLESMTKTNIDHRRGDAEKVSTSIVVKLVEEQSDEIQRLAKDYDKKQKKVMSMKNNEDSRFSTRESKIRMKIALKKKELQQLLSQQEKIDEKIMNYSEKIKIIESKQQENQHQNPNDDDDDKLRMEKNQLTELLNVLRKQKNELKQHCRMEKQRLEQQIEMIDKQIQNNRNNSTDEQQIEKELCKYNEKEIEIKKQLSIMNKRYAIIQRRFDEIPNRIEISQYQKRFIELYNQLSTKHNETKKFYLLYNNLSDERMYLEKEFNLINSILENFQKASTSTPMIKHEFLIKFQQTIETINDNKMKIMKKLQSEKDKREQMMQQYHKLIDEQRLYYLAVKAFKEECKINEQLIIHLEKINKNNDKFVIINK